MPSSRLCAVPGSADVRAIEKDRMHNLSAVIVTYNNSEMLEAVLQDLGLQTMRLHKILLMDNSDNSVTRVMVYRNFHRSSMSRCLKMSVQQVDFTRALNGHSVIAISF